MITQTSYEENLSKSQKTVSDRIKAYLKEPSEENVHDLRTSIRRFLTIANILPKKVRDAKESRRHLQEYEKLMRLNAKVRDIDIVLSKLPNHGDDTAFADIAKRLTESRKSSIKKAIQFASSFKDKDPHIQGNGLSASAIQKRFKKITNNLSKKLRKHLRRVREDPKDLTELHRLREDSRRLRFALEIDDTPETSKLVPLLETWQDILGKIRDSDVLISRFEHEQDSSRMREVVNQEKAHRHENYEKFLEIAKQAPRF